MTVADELARLRVRERELRATPCANCGHPFHEHDVGPFTKARCWHPRLGYVRQMRCRCVAWVDPSETLGLVNE